MNPENIIIGQKYKVVGTKIRSGCDQPCSQCMHYKKGVRVYKKEKSYAQGRIIGVKALDGDYSHCHMHPDDLEPFIIKNWRKRLGGKK